MGPGNGAVVKIPNRMNGRTWQPSNAKKGFMRNTGHQEAKQWDKLMAAMRSSTVKAPLTPDKWLEPAQDESRKASEPTYDLAIEVPPSESSKGQLHAIRDRENL
jgi:hypothetical protein